MEVWAAFWKWFLILGVGVFAVVSAWVTVVGLFDIRRMFRELRRQGGEGGEGGDSALPR